MSASALADVERIWTRARDLYRGSKGSRLPRADNTALLLALLDGPGCGSEIARRAGVNQGNATAHQLPRLRTMRLVDGWETPPSARGGRRAWHWALTPTGRELAEALSRSTPQTHADTPA